MTEQIYATWRIILLDLAIGQEGQARKKVQRGMARLRAAYRQSL